MSFPFIFTAEDFSPHVFSNLKVKTDRKWKVGGGGRVTPETKDTAGHLGAWQRGLGLLP